MSLCDDPSLAVAMSGGRGKLIEAFDAIFTELRVVETLPLTDGRQFEWEYCDVALSFEHFTRECSDFGNLVRELHLKTPSSYFAPWRLVVYFDETTPGNGKRIDLKKKFMAVYVSILEFGPEVLKHDAAWMPAAILRHDIIKLVVGGWSRVLSGFLERLFVTPGLAACGSRMTVFGEDGLLFLTCGRLLGDGDAIKVALDCKGAGGTFPLPEVANVCGIGLKNLAGYGDYIVDITCTDEARYHLLTDAEIYHKVDTLSAESEAVKAKLMTKKEFEKHETQFGLNHNEHGLLQNVALRQYVKPRQCVTHDACHILFSDGIVSIEMALLLPRLSEIANIKFRDIGDFMRGGWTLPRAIKRGSHENPLKAMWSASREGHWKREHSLQAFASDLIACVPALAFMLETSAAVSSLMPLEVASFCKLASLIRCYHSSKLGLSSRARWTRCLSEHAEAYKTAYGTNARYIPKTLWARMLGVQCERDEFTMDCLAPERNHKVLKDASGPIMNTIRFERSVIVRALHLHEGRLNGGWLRDGLNRGKPSPELAEDYVDAWQALQHDLAKAPNPWAWSPC